MSAKPQFHVRAHVLTPKPWIGDGADGFGSTMAVAMQRAGGRLAYMLQGRKPTNRLVVEYNVIERPAPNTKKATPNAPDSPA